MDEEWTWRERPLAAPDVGEIWEGDRRPLGAVVHEKGKKPFSPEVVLWAEASTGAPMGSQVLAPDDPPQAALDGFREALGAAPPWGGPPQIPRTVRLLRPDLADAIRPVADLLGIEIEMVESFAALDGLFAVAEKMASQPPDEGYLQETGIAEPVYADLFAAAADFYRAKPWMRITSEEGILLESDAWSPPYRYAVVLGSGRETYGVAIYPSWTQLQMALKPLPPGADLGERALKQKATAITFATTREVGPVRVEEMKSHGWALATRNAYPLAIASGERRATIWPTEEELRVLIAALRVLPTAVRDLTGPRWVVAGTKYLTDRHRVSVLGEEIEVAATYPARRAARPKVGGA